MRIQGRLALVTGGSSGIGAATATILAERGASVLLVARNLDRLHAVAADITAGGGRAAVYAADLSDATEVRRIARLVQEEKGPPDILINNAGAGRWLPMADTTAEELAATMAVPYFAAFNLTREILPGMLQRRAGHIVNVTSLGSFLAWPNAASYISARWAMRGFNEALRADLHGSGIDVSLVAFGQVSSSYWEHNPGSWERLPAAAHWLRTLTPRDAAGAIAYAIERQRRLVLRPRTIHVVRIMSALFPRATERRMWR